MKITAQLKYLRMAPRKVRLIADAIRGKSVPEAERALHFLTRRAAGPIAKLLSSAVSNAKQNFQISDASSLVIDEIRVDGGPMLKRTRPRAFGRAFSIHKHTSHVRLVLEAKGVAVARRRAGAVTVSEDVEGGAREETAERKTASSRRAFVERSKDATKSKGFVQRMFRRKVI